MTPNQAIELLVKAPSNAFVELIITTNPLKENISNYTVEDSKITYSKGSPPSIH